MSNPMTMLCEPRPFVERNQFSLPKPSQLSRFSSAPGQTAQKIGEW